MVEKNVIEVWLDFKKKVGEISQTELVKQVLKLGINTSRRTIQFWIAYGLLNKPYRHGKFAYHPVSDVEEIVAAHILRGKYGMKIRDVASLSKPLVKHVQEREGQNV